MKKFILGLLVGIAVTAAGSAYADEVNSIVGRAIQGQFPVKIEGKQLDTQAVVVDGTSYLPVRAIGDALNMNVKFDADLGIELTEKGGAQVGEAPQTNPDTKPSNPTGPTDTVLVDTTKPKEFQIKYLQDEIKSLEADITLMKFTLSKWDPNAVTSKDYAKSIADNEDRLNAMKALLEKLQAQ